MPSSRSVAFAALAVALKAGAAAPPQHAAPPTARAATLVALQCRERRGGGEVARLAVEIPELLPAPSESRDEPASLYVARITWAWPALDDDEAAYRQVTLGVTAASGTVFDLYPHGLHTARAVEGALALDAQQRFEVVPKGPGTIPITASAERLGGRRRGAWAYWSVAARPREVVAPGHASAYVLLHVPPGQTHLELRLRAHAHVGRLRFGRLRSVCRAEAEEQVFSLPLPNRRP